MIEPRNLHVLNKCTAIELHLYPFIILKFIDVCVRCIYNVQHDRFLTYMYVMQWLNLANKQANKPLIIITL